MENQRRHVLVVDDNAALASVVRFNLQRAGFEVTVASNGVAAWEFAQDHLFDLVITDQQMPEMTGAEFCRKLRSTEEYAETPIIMLTAKGMEMELPRVREELGITASFLKPFSPLAVVKTVEGCLTAASS